MSKELENKEFATKKEESVNKKEELELVNKKEEFVNEFEFKEFVNKKANVSFSITLGPVHFTSTFVANKRGQVRGQITVQNVENEKIEELNKQYEALVRKTYGDNVEIGKIISAEKTMNLQFGPKGKDYVYENIQKPNGTKFHRMLSCEGFNAIVEKLGDCTVQFEILPWCFARQNGGFFAGATLYLYAFEQQ